MTLSGKLSRSSFLSLRGDDLARPACPDSRNPPPLPICLSHPTAKKQKNNHLSIPSPSPFLLLQSASSLTAPHFTMSDKGISPFKPHLTTCLTSIGSAPQPVRLTPDEKRLYGQLFRIADSGQVGVITGAVAVEFFKKSRLTPSVLAEVIPPQPVKTRLMH